MLTITIDGNITLVQNGRKWIRPVNSLGVAPDNDILVISELSGQLLCQESYSSGITINGENVTSENVDEKLKPFFFLNNSGDSYTKEEIDNKTTLISEDESVEITNNEDGSKDLKVNQDILFPVNTIRFASVLSGNIFGEKYLKCDGSVVSITDYPSLKLPEKVSLKEWSEYNIGATLTTRGFEKLNGVYFAFSGPNKIYVCRDVELSNWESKAPNLNTGMGGNLVSMRSMDYGMGVFASPAYKGVQISSDIDNWSLLSITQSQSPGWVRFVGDTEFLWCTGMGTGGGYVGRSFDLVASEIKNISTDNINILEKFKNAYIAAGANGAVYKSSDFNDWSKIELNRTSEIKIKIIENKLFLFCDDNKVTITEDLENYNTIDLEFSIKNIEKYGDKYLILSTINTIYLTENFIDFQFESELKTSITGIIVDTDMDRVLMLSYRPWIVFESLKGFQLPNIENAYIKALE
ncbi:hypothetical protein LJC11_03060 [Bacteroidales bacterium OttesenSCG-928-I21]|nr:hypothetical protein [Bacteroidales bacterium OttesenSCG-928-I21]